MAMSPSSGSSDWNRALLISTSGLADASLRMDVVANNVANSNTDGFIPDRVNSVASATGGVTSEVEPALDPYTIEGLQRGAEETATPFSSQADYITEGVSLLLAKHAFQANARAIRASSETGKALIDMLG
jgi:flagellar hook protein FlgE